MIEIDTLGRFAGLGHNEKVGMKSTIVTILQQLMDKQTSEQFWAVAALTAMNAFVVAQQETIAKLPAWAVVLAITAATAYGAYFVIDRHVRYYFYRAEMAKLLRNEQDIPEFIKTVPNTWKGRSLLGVGFYTGWILGTWLLGLVTLL